MMTAWRDPQRGLPVIRDFIGTGSTDRAASRAERATRRVPRVRALVVAGKVMYAINAHDLLDATAESMGRPGLPY